MRTFSERLGIAVAGLLLAATPALAQAAGERERAVERRPAADSTTTAGNTTAGSGGSGGASANAGSGGSANSGGGSSTSTPSDSPFNAPMSNEDHHARSRPAPSDDARRAPTRGASTSSERAVSRDTGSAPRGDVGSSRSGPEVTSNPSTLHDATDWSRPRGDRPATDIAVPRIGPRPPRDSNERNHPKGRYDVIYFDAPIYLPMYGWFDYPIVYDPFVSAPRPYPQPIEIKQGLLKLKVKPRNARVYVNGVYVGRVDEFDGGPLKLRLNGGRHKVELRADGYETTELDVLISPDKTVTFAGTMKKVQ